ncbi:MAG: chlorite dismutase family protein [Phycisphaeraceae bacterium]
MSERSHSVVGRPALEEVDLREHGAKGTTSDRRLFIQFQAFSRMDGQPAPTTQDLVAALSNKSTDLVLYEDARDPRGFGLALASEDPGVIMDVTRQVFADPAWQGLTIKPEYTMMGRTYALGYEADLEDTLLQRPRRHLLEAEWPWCVWYPLRRAGAFETLEKDEQRAILGEHATIGMSWARSGVARDIRLACHGLAGEDNDFVLALFAHEVHPLSALVNRMRSTVQTSRYLEKLGPFFLGRAVWRSTTLQG